MRVAIAGAGNVGRSIARELISNGHQVLLIEKDPTAINPDSVPGAEWFQADACELQSLEEAELENCDVAIAASGDDKVNLVHSLPRRSSGCLERLHESIIQETSGSSTRPGELMSRFLLRASCLPWWRKQSQPVIW